MKTCTTCGKPKSLDSYYSSRSKSYAQCKECVRARVKEYRLANPEIIAERKKRYREENLERVYGKNKARYREKKQEILAKQREYNEKNKDAINTQKSAYYLANREKFRELGKAYRERNLDRHNFSNAKRRAAKKSAIPGWADMDAIRKIYRKARSMGGMHVDHIVPLQSDLVCGLHCEANLQIIPSSENVKKSNRYWPDMP